MHARTVHDCQQMTSHQFIFLILGFTSVANRLEVLHSRWNREPDVRRYAKTTRRSDVYPFRMVCNFTAHYFHLLAVHAHTVCILYTCNSLEFQDVSLYYCRVTLLSMANHRTFLSHWFRIPRYYSPNKLSVHGEPYSEKPGTNTFWLVKTTIMHHDVSCDVAVVV